MSSDERKQPVHIVRVGRIQASVWENKSAEQGTWYSVTFHRHYDDAKGQHYLAASFGRDDLLTVAEVARAAWWWVGKQRAATEGGGK